MLTFDATEQINEVSRTRTRTTRTTTTTQVITRYFGRWPQTTTTQVITRYFGPWPQTTIKRYCAIRKLLNSSFPFLKLLHWLFMFVKQNFKPWQSNGDVILICFS